MITKALVLLPGRRATALSICDRIAEMQPYYKHHSGNWKTFVYSSLVRNKNIFSCTKLSENISEFSQRYIWGFNPNFEKFMIDKWLPKFVQNKAKLVTQTDIGVESEILTSSPTSASNKRVSSVNSLDPDIIIESEILTSSPIVAAMTKDSSVNSLDPDVVVESEIFTSSPTVNTSNTTNSSFGSVDIFRRVCEQSSINSSSMFPIGDSTHQSVTKGIQPPNRLNSSEENVARLSADLDRLMSKLRNETQYGTGSSSSESFPEFALADPVQLEDRQSEEINPLEPEAIVSGRPTRYLSNSEVFVLVICNKIDEIIKI